MKESSVMKSLVKFSLPLILSGILQQLYSWADAFIVGNVEGETALAAIGATGTVINLYILVITGFTLGLTIVFAQYYGSGKIEKITQMLSSFVWTLGILFLGISVAGYLFTPGLLRALHTTTDTIQLATVYLKLIMIGIPFLAIYNVYSAGLRGIGDSRIPFYSVLFSSILNVILDIVFVYILKWGVKGAAVATVLSQIAMTIFLIIYAIKKHAILRIKTCDTMIDKESLIHGAKFGFPPMIQSSITALGSLLLQNFMNSFGTLTVAAITTAYRVDTILLLPITNLGSAISTIVAQNFGAGKMKETKRAYKDGIILMLFICPVLTVSMILFGGTVIGWFGVGAKVIKIGQNFFTEIAAFYLIFGLFTAARGYLEGLGDVMYSSIIGIAGLIVRIAASYILKPFWGRAVIAYAEVISWFILLAWYLVRIKQLDRRNASKKLL